MSVPKVRLEAPGIDTIVCQLEAGGVAQHVGMDLQAPEVSLGRRALQQPGEASRRKRCSAFRHEQER